MSMFTVIVLLQKSSESHSLQLLMSPVHGFSSAPSPLTEKLGSEEEILVSKQQ